MDPHWPEKWTLRNFDSVSELLERSRKTPETLSHIFKHAHTDVQAQSRPRDEHLKYSASPAFSPSPAPGGCLNAASALCLEHRSTVCVSTRTAAGPLTVHHFWTCSRNTTLQESPSKKVVFVCYLPSAHVISFSSATKWWTKGDAHLEKRMKGKNEHLPFLLAQT